MRAGSVGVRKIHDVVRIDFAVFICVMHRTVLWGWRDVIMIIMIIIIIIIITIGLIITGPVGTGR